MKKLRIARVVVQPVFIWDDGEELSDGPTVEPVSLPHSQLAQFVANLPEQVAALAEQLAERE